MSIVEVAKRAGVSTATVSRVLNQLPNVRPETVQQVKAAIKALGYQTPEVKRGPKAGQPRKPGARRGGIARTKQIAVVTIGNNLHWLEMPVMAAVLGGVTREARAHGLQTVLDESPEGEALAPVVRRREVSGVVAFMNAREPEQVLEEIRRYGPTVWITNGEASDFGTDHASADNTAVGHMACRYLLGQGCEHLAFITANPEWHFMRLRYAAFGDAARDAGLRVCSYVRSCAPLVLEAYGAETVVRGNLEDLVTALAQRLQPNTGLFVPTDLLTTEVQPLLVRHGVQPGRDITLVSCDNEQVRLSSLRPRPVTIDWGAEEVGRRAVQQLLRRMQRPAEIPVRLQVAPRLVMPPEDGQV